MVPDPQSNLSETEDWPLPGAVAGLVETGRLAAEEQSWPGSPPQPVTWEPL
jgi:hypothetical protein